MAHHLEALEKVLRENFPSDYLCPVKVDTKQPQVSALPALPPLAITLASALTP